MKFLYGALGVCFYVAGRYPLAVFLVSLLLLFTIPPLGVLGFVLLIVSYGVAQVLKNQQSKVGDKHDDHR